MDIGDTFTITINTKSVTVTATAATVLNVTALLTTAFNASIEPEFMEITATDSTTLVTLTADTKGKSFTNTSSSVGGTNTTAILTANSGPNVWNAANWSAATLPADTEDVYIENSNVDILYNINHTAIELTSLTIPASYTGKIGNPNANGTYREYRDKYLVIGATTTNIGAGEGAGSGRIKLNFEAEATTINVYKTGPTAEQGYPSLMILGTAITALNITEGDVGVAVESTQVSTITTVRLGYENSPSTDGKLVLGSGCTLTTILQSGGSLEINSAFTTLTMTDGTTTIKGVGTKTTINCRGGKLIYNSTGTITTLNLSGFIDFSQDQRALTITNAVQIFKGARLYDPHSRVTFSAGIVLNQCRIEDVEIDVGVNRTITPS